MKILVTGGAGYIGSHTVVELINKGFTPVIADNFSNSRIEAVRAVEKITKTKIELINADLCSKRDTEKIFDSHNIDATIHFAAFKSVGDSVINPLAYYRNNIYSLINLLEIQCERNITDIVFSSSCSVYGQSDELPVTEKTPLKKAESPYGNTKQVGEEILRDVIKTGKLKGIALRYFNPGGAHESALIGEYPLQAPNNLVPVITQTAIGKRKSFTVFGNDYNTSDGTCIRDYIHVVDIARAHLAAIERIRNKNDRKPFEIFNLGCGKGSTVLEAISTFEKVTGQKVNYEMGARRPGDVEKVWADTTLANAELSWNCNYTLEDIMSSAWAWELNLKNSGV